MTLLDELAALVRELDAAGVEYALVGGLAVAIWGAPRATGDALDIQSLEELDR